LATHTLLRLHSSLAEAMLTRLQRFVLRADVRIDAPGDALAAIGVWGPGAVQLLQQARLPAPDAAEACAAQGSVQVTRQPSAVPRFELRGPRTALTVPWNLIAEHATRVGSNAWRLLDILEGVPDISAPTSGHFLAQSLNLDLSGAIHFDKGCYSGQEIIARLHYRGRAARRMYLLRAKGPPPAPGDPVHHLREAAAIGEVVDAAEAEDGSCAIAAVLRIPHADDGLYLPAAPRRALTPPTPFTYARSAALSS
ncbi:MAG TPA: hypothetical protein VF265_01795, partial [Nevskiaceae bacterium]